MSDLKRTIKTEQIPNKLTQSAQLLAACVAQVATLGDTTAEAALVTTAMGTLTTENNTYAALSQQASQQLLVRDAADDALSAELEGLLKKLELNTKGDKIKLAESGLETFEPGTAAPLGAPAQVLNLHVSQGDNPGELEVAWNGLKPRPRVYKVRMCADPYNQATMVDIGLPSGSRSIKTGLTSGGVYWFEVCAVGSSDQQGPWSDPAKGRAP